MAAWPWVFTSPGITRCPVASRTDTPAGRGASPSRTAEIPSPSTSTAPPSRTVPASSMTTTVPPSIRSRLLPVAESVGPGPVEHAHRRTEARSSLPARIGEAVLGRVPAGS